ncbi:MAG TPA: 3'(2'),5'-bisphosphate nucleotidase CysQ [Stellaceae bacterium]|nr:3'(2'),5'-bisphosphate nucleotidase CysQ [Stellaceae bacterium]
MDTTDKNALLDLAIAAALAAGPKIMAIYAQDFAVERKEDKSPVTLADTIAEATILEILKRDAPDIVAIAEEQESAHGSEGAAPSRFWAIDPLDGTREFVARNGEFTVNIGLIENRAPVLGVVYAPAIDLLFAAAGPGTARRRIDGRFQPVSARKVPEIGPVIVHSRSHDNSPRIAEFAATLHNASRMVSGSAIKFCKLAAGEADIYPRFGPTMEWDTAAGQAILEAAGGSVSALEGGRLAYGKPEYRNGGFIARGRTS